MNFGSIVFRPIVRLVGTSAAFVAYISFTNVFFRPFRKVRSAFVGCLVVTASTRFAITGRFAELGVAANGHTSTSKRSDASFYLSRKFFCRF